MRLLLLAVVVSLLLDTQTAGAQPKRGAGDRLKECLSQMDRFEHRTSVLVYEVYTTDNIHKELLPTVKESVYRQVVDAETKSRRIDRQIMRADGVYTYYESSLKSDKSILFAAGYVPGESVQRLDRASMQEARGTKSLFMLPLSDTVALSGDNSASLASIAKCRILSETTLGDGTYRVLYMPPSGLALIEYA
jgi:hypothetical protein